MAIRAIAYILIAICKFVADEMLAQGFREDIEHILTDAPEDRQTVLFSATMSKEILAITSQFLNNP